MRACLYLRKSTDEHQAESLETQEAGARAWCTTRGMTVARVIVDSGISRAEFVKRPGLLELIAGAKRGDFEAVVTRDPTRFGGDTFRGGLAIESILDGGCKLFYYFAGREVDATDDTWKVTTALDGWRSETERKTLAGRTREALEIKAARGHCAGGRVYGYRNVRVFEGPNATGRKLRTEYAIDNAQAEVVRRIYQLFAGGEGYRGIARALNADGVPSPRGGSWDMSTVRVVLFNERYFGRIVWGRIGSAYKGGTHVAVAKPESAWTVAEAPELRIVPPELERRVAVLRSSNAALYSGRTAIGARQPKYLLIGLARCAGCGGPICPRNTKQGAATVKSYGCRHYFARGRSVCQVNALRPMASVDRAVLDWFAHHVLSDRFVRRVYAIARERLARELAVAPAAADDLAGEASRLRAEVSRLVAALARTTEQPESVIELIGKKERQLRSLEQRIAARAVPAGSRTAALDRAESLARAKVADLRGLLSEPEKGRAALAALLDGPLRFRAVETAEGRRFELSGRYALGPLLASEGVASIPTDCDPNGDPSVEVPQIAGDFCIREAA